MSRWVCDNFRRALQKIGGHVCGPLLISHLLRCPRVWSWLNAEAASRLTCARVGFVRPASTFDANVDTEGDVCFPTLLMVYFLGWPDYRFVRPSTAGSLRPPPISPLIVNQIEHHPVWRKIVHIVDLFTQVEEIFPVVWSHVVPEEKSSDTAVSWTIDFTLSFFPTRHLLGALSNIAAQFRLSHIHAFAEEQKFFRSKKFSVLCKVQTNCPMQSFGIVYRNIFFAITDFTFEPALKKYAL
nr:hypothetical protein [Erythrobacter crassostrea]